ncbi:uncharacterized protein LOC113213861 [Frankliniella occidentalis]|uniref:Uncharacterized protein LOC113213861 n=1 Tax=Frankliniella occidentalis TaxID=133901 RepID=A0A6J1T6I5_FRAOC|nr:uncharacterized protein LOC113213861 [Frankliniella occidentalis]
MVQMERSNSKEFQRRVLSVAPVMEKHLDSLKTDFRTEIDSNRRLESINTFDELIAVLVKRNFIDDSDMKTWTKLNPKFQKYEQILFHEDNGFSVRPQNHLRARQHICLTDDVIVYLSSRITHSWRNFGRNLGLTQKHIDEIEKKYDTDYPQCVREVLQIYEENQAWMSKSNGNPLEDIMKTFELINRGYLIPEFTRLTGFNQLNPR